MKKSKFHGCVRLAKIANTLASLRRGKDDREFVLKNVDRTDKEFLEFIEKEEKEIEEIGYRAGEKAFNEITKLQPTYFKECKEKKPSIVFELSHASKLINTTFLEAKLNQRDERHMVKHLVSNQAVGPVHEIRDFTSSLQRMTASKLKKALDDNKKIKKKTFTIVINTVKRMLQCNCEQYLPEVPFALFSS